MPFLDDNIVLDQPADSPAAPAPDAPAQADTPAPPGWHIETIPDRHGVPRQYAVSPDDRTMVALGHGDGQPGGAPVAGATPTSDQPAAGAAPAAEVPPAAPVGGTFLPDDIKLDEPAPPPHSWLDELGIAGRAAVKGVDNIAQMMAAGGGPLKAGVDLAHALGVDPTSLLDRAGVARPETDNERLASEAITGAATSVPFAAVGGPVLGALASGAGAGAAGEEARQAGYGPGVQLAASLAGGGAAGLATGIPRAAAGLLPSNRTVLTPEMQAFADEGVPALPADVGGIASRFFTGIGNATLGGIPIQIAARKSIDAARALRDRIAATIGSPFRTMGQSDATGAGLAAQRGLKAILGEGGTKEAVGQRLYRTIPIAPEANAVVSNSRTALADLNEGLTSNPALSELIQDKRLLAYQRAFNGETEHIPTGILDAEGNALTRPVQKGGRLSWKDLQSFRSYVGKLAGRPTLQDDTSQEALRRLYAGLSEDMRATAAAQGKEALAKFTRANNYWRGLEARRAQILKPLLGDKLDLHGAAAFRQIEQWATKDRDVFALGRALRSMPEQEANDVRATIFDRLGTATASNQDREGLAFSPSMFMRHWSGMDSRAKAVLFPGAEYQKSIDNIVRISAAQKGAQQFANVSKTGNVVNAVSLLAMLRYHPLYFLASAGSEVGAGLLLASPRFARWLASAPAKPNAPAMLAHINRLSTIAASEPQIANEVLALQQRLATIFTGAGSPLPIAAKDKKNGGKKPPQQQGNGARTDDAAKGPLFTGFDQIQHKYPFIAQYKPVVITSPNRKPYGSETWPVGEEGTPDNPRPAGLPKDRVGVEIYKPDQVTAEDVAAEFLHVDPKAHQTRRALLASLSPAQLTYLKHEARDYGDSRSSETKQKRLENAVDSAMRGYVFGQWPASANARMNYTPEQRQMLDGLKSYVTGGRAR